jgi:hypothetical protein
MREKVLSVGGKDLEWEFFRAGGKGGQKQNKTSTGARVHHRASGVTAESREHRTQLENRKEALRRLAGDPQFQAWVRLTVTGAELEVQRSVAEAMRPEHLLIETF